MVEIQVEILAAKVKHLATKERMETKLNKKRSSVEMQDS